jgi:hypothetical protein
MPQTSYTMSRIRDKSEKELTYENEYVTIGPQTRSFSRVHFYLIFRVAQKVWRGYGAL